MEMSGEIRIDAKRSQVWAALNDPATLKDLIPGCTALAKPSANEWTGTVDVKVGMVRATFDGKATLSNVNAPLSFTLAGEGKGGVAGTANGTADVKLFEDGDNTILRYTAQGQVSGKLAQVGPRLIDTTAKQIADQFLANLAKKMNESPLMKAEHAVENAVEHAVEEVVEVAEEAEEEVEKAAVRGFLGGPMMWGLLVIIVGVVALYFLR
jgi:carbon monoxide dehydrogenase subunit G